MTLRQRLIVYQGLPASGKTTLARAQVDKHYTWKRINRDSLRDMLDNSKHTDAKEKEIRKAELLLAEHFMNAGYHVLVDDCNLSPSAMEMWQQFAERMNTHLEIEDLTHVSPEECIERDTKRPNSVGAKVIYDMYYRYLYKPPTPVPYDPALPDATMSDIDGTLALHWGVRNPYDTTHCDLDKPHWKVITAVKQNRRLGHHLIITSGRKEQARAMTLAWLATYELYPDLLLMRKDGDSRRDYIIKQEMYEEHIKGKYNVIQVFDDRKQVMKLWWSLGLPAFQVAEGDF